MVLLSTFVKEARNHKIMGAFAIQNSIKIFKYQESSLNTLNGVRSLMMLWVVFSHEYAFSLNNAENLFSFTEIVSRWQFIIIVSGYFSVDAFFFIGGFLVAYAFLKEQSTSFFKYPLAILNRYLRLIPAYFVTMMIYYHVFPHLGSGPLWYQLQQQTITPCDNGWWKSLLFISNLTDHLGDICLGWGWYLQNDMQLFVYSVFLLAIYGSNKMAGYLSIVWSMLASFAYTMVITYTYQLHNNNQAADISHTNLMTDTLYIVPWSRAPPYLLGLLLGILYVNFLFEEKKKGEHMFIRLKEKFNRSRVSRIGFELVGVMLVFFVMFIQRTNQFLPGWPQLVHSLYLTYAKTLFVMGLGIAMLPSLLSVGSMINFSMDTKMFNFVAKVSYCTYLVHFMFLQMWTGGMIIDYYYSLLTEYELVVAHSFMSILGGFILCVMVEIPFAKLQKMLMTSLMKKKVQKVREPSEGQLNESLKEK